VAAAELAMCMLGSQRPKLGAGQVTDDSELTISLARGGPERVAAASLLTRRSGGPECSLASLPHAGLLGHRPSAGFPLESVAQQYAAWHAAGAFAGGQTCQMAFSTPRTPDRGKWMKGGEGEGRGASPLAMRMQVTACLPSLKSVATSPLSQRFWLAGKGTSVVRRQQSQWRTDAHHTLGDLGTQADAQQDCNRCRLGRKPLTPKPNLCTRQRRLCHCRRTPGGNPWGCSRRFGSGHHLGFRACR
jgi:hypothetical protein